MWLIAITGASGIYRVKGFLEMLNQRGVEYRVVLSEGAKRVIERERVGKNSEVNRIVDDWKGLDILREIESYREDEIDAPFASGSYRYEGLVIFPASMNTVAKIACGIADNLITRAAKVVLKERRKLIVVFREAPLSEIDLENLLKIARVGGVVFPLVDQSYSRSERFLECRILDQMGVESECERWGENSS